MFPQPTMGAIEIYGKYKTGKSENYPTWVSGRKFSY